LIAIESAWQLISDTRPVELDFPAPGVLWRNRVLELVCWYARWTVQLDVDRQLWESRARRYFRCEPMRSNLELLLLSLVRDGLGTPYELKARADISLGSAIPALARLESDGLVKASAKEARGSRRFTLTAKGSRVLGIEWQLQLQSGTTDVDSILRITYLSWMNGSASKAAIFLVKSADRIHELATMASSEATLFGSSAEAVDNDALRWLRARVAARRLEAESRELLALARRLRSASKSKGRGNARRRTKKTS
jgi:DNA-binding PadR family transcriptional regulator